MSKKILKEKKEDMLVPPEKLLESAEALIKTKNENFFRPAVLESITALEVFVRDLIIKALEKNYGSNVRKGVEKRTQFSFEDRLDWVMELATGKTLKEENKMWSKFKEIRSIRNKIVHAGMAIHYEDAKKAYNLVKSILGFLLAEIEIPRFLEEYKENIEKQIKRKKTLIEHKALEVFLQRKFQEFKIGESLMEADMEGYRPDIIYKAGDYKFIVEIKMVRTERGRLNLFAMVKNIEKILKRFDLDKIFIIAIMPRGQKAQLITNSKKLVLLTADII